MGPAAQSSPPLPSSSLPSRLARVAAIAAALVAIVAAGVPLCPIAVVTRHPCPGCGLTRATLAMLRGHLGEAVTIHPLAPIVSPIVGGLVLYACISYVRHGRWVGASGRSAGVIAAVGIALWTLLFAVWIARFHGALGGPVPV